MHSRHSAFAHQNKTHTKVICLGMADEQACGWLEHGGMSGGELLRIAEKCCFAEHGRLSGGRQRHPGFLPNQLPQVWVVDQHHQKPSPQDCRLPTAGH